MFSRYDTIHSLALTASDIQTIIHSVTLFLVFDSPDVDADY